MIAVWMLYAAAVSIPFALGAEAASALLRRAGRPERGVWWAGLLGTLVAPVVALAYGVGTPDTHGAPVGAIPLSLGLPEAVPIGASNPLLGADHVVLLVWLGASGMLALRLLRSVRAIVFKTS